MHIAGGTFYGYREILAVNPRHRMLRASRALGIPKLDPIQIENLETPTFINRTFPMIEGLPGGYAEDEFPDDFTFFGFTSRHIVVWLKHAPVDIIYTFDGIHELELRVITESYRAVEAVQGYKIRNNMPGWAAWYEIMVFW